MLTNPCDFVDDMMKRGLYAELLVVLKESFANTENPESYGRLPLEESLKVIVAINHLEFVVKHGADNKGFWDEKKRFICPKWEAFREWRTLGCKGLWDQDVSRHRP